MNRIPNTTVEELRERVRQLIEESERIIERTRQIEAETRPLVKPLAEALPKLESRKFAQSEKE